MLSHMHIKKMKLHVYMVLLPLSKSEWAESNTAKGTDVNSTSTIQKNTVLPKAKYD